MKGRHKKFRFYMKECTNRLAFLYKFSYGSLRMIIELPQLVFTFFVIFIDITLYSCITIQTHKTNFAYAGLPRRKTKYLGWLKWQLPSIFEALTFWMELLVIANLKFSIKTQNNILLYINILLDKYKISWACFPCQ